MATEPTRTDEQPVEPSPAPAVARRRPNPGQRLALGLRRIVQLSFLVVASAVMVVVGWVHSEDFQRRAVALLETLVEDLTGEACTVTHVRVGFWPPGLEVDGFHLHDHASGETILSAERVRVPLVLRNGGPDIGRLSLQRPVIQLHVEADGKLREFRGMHRPQGDGPKQPLRRLPFSSLEITDGVFRIAHPDGHLRVDDLDVMPTTGNLADITFDLDVAARDLREQTRVALPRVVLGPDRVEIPVLTLDTAILDLAGRAAWPLGGDLDVDLTGRVDLERANALLVPPRAVHGLLDLDVRIEGPTSDPTVELAFLGQRIAFEVPGVHTPVLSYELGDLAAAVVVDTREVVIEKATAFIGDEGELSVWGRITLDDRRLHDSRVVASRVSLAHLLRAFDAAPTPWVDMSTDLEVGWQGTLDPLRLEGHFDLTVADLRVADRPIDEPVVELMLDIPAAHAKGTLLLEKDHILITAPTVVGPRNRGSTVVDIGFGPRGPLDLQADLTTADLADFQPLRGVPLSGRGRVTGRIFGPFNALQVHAQGDLADFSVLGIPYADRLQARIISPDMKTLELRDAVAVRGSTPYTGSYRIDFRTPLSMDTEITIGAGRVEDLVGMFIELPGMRGELQGGSLSLHGPLFDMDGESHLALGATELWGERFTHGEGHGYMDAGLFTLDDLRVLREDGREGLVMRGSVERDWFLDMELIGDGFALERLDTLAPAEQPLSGNVALHSRITGTLFEPSPDGRVALTDVRFAGNPVDDSLVLFDSTDGVMSYSGALVGGTAQVDGTLGLWGEQPYAMTAALERLPAHIFYPIAADGSPIRALASGDLEISGDFGEVWSPVTLRADIADVEVRYGRHVLRNDATWRYAQDGNSYQVTDFNLVGGSTDLTLSASGGEYLELGGSGTVDLDLLRAVVPGLTRASGSAQVQLRAEGAKPNVEAVVDLVVDAELLRYESVPATFEDFTAQVRVTDDQIVLENVQAGLGGGTLRGGGTIDAKDWVPSRYDLHARIDDAQVQWVDTLPPAIGDANLRFDGPVDALLLHGDVTVTDMTFSDRIDWEDWVVEYREEMLVDPATLYDETSYFSLNVHIDADRTIHLRNNMAEGTASADLRVIGDTARPGLVGTVQVVEGVAFLQDREFRIDRGNLLFNDPWSWDPEVDFGLVTDIENRDQRYRVNYLVHGPFSDWRSSSRSDPALPQADVNALLWFGVTTEELEESGELSSAVAQGVADLILTDFLITNQAGEFAQDLPEFLFDRIDLATGVNGRGEYSPEPRLLVEKRLTEVGGVDLDVDVRWEFNLIRPEDNYVRADKRIGGIWSLSGWYASLQRDRVLPIGGAYGVDVTARWETE